MTIRQQNPSWFTKGHKSFKKTLYFGCLIEDCDRPHAAKQYCSRHYNRLRLYGDPMGGKRFKLGQGKHPEYKSWVAAKERCFVLQHKDYPRWGGRGITMCDGWRNNSQSFLDDMGQRPTPSHSIDRIDNDGHYSCGHCDHCVSMGWSSNCKWSTKSEQINNRRPRSEWKTT
jgi:hypothetical protein